MPPLSMQCSNIRLTNLQVLNARLYVVEQGSSGVRCRSATGLVHGLHAAHGGLTAVSAELMRERELADNWPRPR